VSDTALDGTVVSAAATGAFSASSAGTALRAMRGALPVLLVGVVMAAVAQVGTRDVLFPEGTALAWGAWVIGRLDWRLLRLRLVVTPVLCGACGLLTSTLLPTRLAAELTALTAALVVIVALRAPVGPAVSAAVLPALAGIRGFWYVLSVCVIAATVLGLAMERGRSTPPPPKEAVWSEEPATLRGLAFLAEPAVLDDRPARSDDCAPRERLSSPRWAEVSPWQPALTTSALITWAVAAAWLAIASAAGLPLAASAPPLLVALFEWVSGDRRKSVRAGIRLGAVLTVSWAVGGVIAWHVGSLTLAAALSLVSAVLLVVASRVELPPAIAVTLVPLVLGPPHSWTGLLAGVCSVAAAIAFLYLAGAAALRVARLWPALRPVPMSQGVTDLRPAAASSTTRSQP
jgi:hypothetical protein